MTKPAGTDVLDASDARFGAAADVVVVGAGAAGLTAALKAREAGAEVIVLERDALPRGSTALSAGLIPAAGTRFQIAKGIADDEAAFAADIIKKSGGEADPVAVATVVAAAPAVLHWLAERHGLPFDVLDNFTYPGHSACRMHGLPTRSGAELMDRLTAAAQASGADIVTNARVTALFRKADGEVAGVRVERPDGGVDDLAAGSLVLACNGYGGNPAMVAAEIPEIAGALYFGHARNQGDAVLWGRALGAGVRHLAGHQGHGNVAQPHGILITWATITEGGFQINAEGCRFHDESAGYSEAAAAVLAQPGGVAWTIFDARIAEIARQFEDFRQAERAGAIISAGSVGELAAAMRLPVWRIDDVMQETAKLKRNAGTDAFGRAWSGALQLAPPFHAVRVTGTLFHTQGGLVVDEHARVRRASGGVFINLFAAGGAACGVSGSRASGYLSGNGLLTALTYGYLAGSAAFRAA
jgi:fumarate reductase flavoprotein subunit